METNKKTTWKVDSAHSEVEFKVRHMMISTVNGRFDEFEGSVETSSEDFKNAQFTFTAEINSINTKNSDRDTHLKSDDFFGMQNHPQLTFTSKSFDGSKMVGDLSIKGITKEVTLDAEFNGTAVDSYGQTKAGFEFEGEISRKEFGLSWNDITEAGNIVVSDKVRLIVSLQFIKQ